MEIKDNLEEILGKMRPRPEPDQNIRKRPGRRVIDGGLFGGRRRKFAKTVYGPDVLLKPLQEGSL